MRSVKHINLYLKTPLCHPDVMVAGQAKFFDINPRWISCARVENSGRLYYQTYVRAS